MAGFIHYILRGLTVWVPDRFRKEDGSATIEFALIFPVYIVLLLSSFESGFLMSRQVFLERGLDMAIREVRIDAISPVTHDVLKQRICHHAGGIPDCLDAVRVEMRPVDLLNWNDLPRRADCIDRDDPSAPLRSFTEGGANQLVIVRACALFDPVFPTLGLGARIPRESGTEYALIAMSAYVKEPD